MHKQNVVAVAMLALVAFASLAAPPFIPHAYAGSPPSPLAAWSNTTPYPLAIQQATCVTDAFSETSYIYCIGGNINNSIAESAAYFNTVSSSGVGPTWMNTTAYPTSSATAALSCVVSNHTMDCVGMGTATYYASL